MIWACFGQEGHPMIARHCRGRERRRRKCRFLPGGGGVPPIHPVLRGDGSADSEGELS